MPNVLSLSSCGSVQDWRLEVNANDQICCNVVHEDNARERRKELQTPPQSANREALHLINLNFFWRGRRVKQPIERRFVLFENLFT